MLRILGWTVRRVVRHSRTLVPFHCFTTATMAYFYNIFIASPWQQWLIFKIFVWLIQGDRVRQPPSDLAEKPGTAEH